MDYYSYGWPGDKPGFFKERIKRMPDITLRNEKRTARKQYYCDWCGALISKGEKYQYLYGGKDTFGKMTVLRYCKKCQK
jgi:hypothetical protein